MPNIATENMRAKYGPWAVIAGASDGTGAEYARQLAAAGINLLLVSRRQEVLDKLAAELHADHNIETRTLALDLYAEDAPDRVFAAARDLEVGMYVSNAGADKDFRPMLDRSLDEMLALIRFNVINVTKASYYFLQPMRKRGRGGAVIMSSVSGLVGGQPGSGLYSATKAFELVFAESLWAELRGDNVDVIGIAAPPMATPTAVEILGAVGMAKPEILAGLYRPDDVVSSVLSMLGKEPSHVFNWPGVDIESGDATAATRHGRIKAVEDSIVKLFGMNK